MKKSGRMSVRIFACWLQLAVASVASAQTVDQLIPHKVRLESAEYLGKHAVKITEDGQVADGEAYAIVKGSAFHNGAIDVELAGRPPPPPPPPRPRGPRVRPPPPPPPAPPPHLPPPHPPRPPSRPPHTSPPPPRA